MILTILLKVPNEQFDYLTFLPGACIVLVLLSALRNALFRWLRKAMEQVLPKHGYCFAIGK